MSLFETAKGNTSKFFLAVKELINSASFNKSFRATVTEKVNNTVYKVLYKNAEYKVKSYYDLIVGDLVWVCAPGNDWDSLFVQSYNGFRDRVITTDKIVNNYTTNVAGTVLDGRMGKTIKTEIDALTNNLNTTNTNLSNLSSTKANKTEVHNLLGANVNGSSLLNWASDEAKRLSVWQVQGNSVSGFPDVESEWCALNLQDASAARGIVIALKYTSGNPTIKYRCYFNKAWLGDWKTVV
ncbi:hypothetical protein AALB39_04595 [Lachnospiraceae bacterium 54-53]